MNINFESESDRAKVSVYSLSVIQSLMMIANIEEVMVTSVQRTPAAQAHAMFVNCLAYGAEKETALYAAPGRAVVAVFAAEKAKGTLPEQIVAAMTAKIVALGPQNVSHHCISDSSKLNVIDIGAHSIQSTQRRDFHLAVSKCVKLSRFFDPYTVPMDPAFHLEIPQPPGEASPPSPQPSTPAC